MDGFYGRRYRLIERSSCARRRAGTASPTQRRSNLSFGLGAALLGFFASPLKLDFPIVPAMTNRPAPTLSKWIYVLTDVLLLIVLVWILRAVLPPQKTGDYVVIIFAAISWMIGAWICIKPWQEEFRARNKHLENETLASAVEQIQKLEEVAGRIQTATGSWQSAQDAATRTATAAREIEEKIKANMTEFMEFNERVNSDEKKHLNLEIEKLRRVEADWLQVTARMLDHTYMLNQAGQRSGQANLINQLNNFQNAMRESVRRMGLISFTPALGEEFNARMHQTETPDTEPPSGSVVNEILATGFTFQGQLLRRALVRVIAPQSGTPAETQPAEEEAAPDPAGEPTPEATAEAAAEPMLEAAATEPSSEAGPEPEPRPSEASAEAVASSAEIADSAPFDETTEAPVPSETDLPVERQVESEEPVEAQPRRRSRKADPQTSLPF